MRLRGLALSLACYGTTLVSGCGGSSGGGQTVGIDAVSHRLSTSQSLASVRHVGDAPDEGYVIRIESIPPVARDIYHLPVVVPGLPEDFTSFRGSGSDSGYYIVYGLTPSGGGEVFAFANRGYAIRLEETQIVPLDATYNGTYAGVYADPDAYGDILGHIVGDAELTVNYGTGTVSGLISNRQNNTGSALAADVTLEPGTLADGAFDGVASGGAIDGFTSAGGGYTGLIVGPNGEEVVGLVWILHEGASADYSEVGGLIATR